MNWTDLKAAVAAIIKTNGNEEITGALLQQVLINIIDNIGANRSYKGVATTTTNPGTPDGGVYYFATSAGTYANFSGIVIANKGLYVLQNTTGAWEKATVWDLSEESGGIDPKGEYDPEVTYEFLEMVTFGGGSYLSMISANDEPLSNAEAWMVVATKGDPGDNAYIYIGFASSNAGANFSLTPSDALPYVAILNSETVIETPEASDFEGLWRYSKGPQGANAFVYVGYASSNAGADFSLVPSDSLPYTAILNTETEIESPAVGDFAGLWRYSKGPQGGSTLNTAIRTVAMAAYEVDLEAGEDFTKTCGSASAFTIANLIIKKPFRMFLTGGSLNTALFTGYTTTWRLGAASEYNNAIVNRLWCEVMSAGQIEVMWGV